MQPLPDKSVLLTLEETDSCRCIDLAADLRWSGESRRQAQTRIFRILKQMEESGLAYKEDDWWDLTPKGRIKADKLRAKEMN